MIQLPEFLLFLHKCLGEMLWRKNGTNIWDNRNTRKISTSKGALDDNYKHPSEMTLIQDRMFKLEVHMQDVLRKLDHMATTIKSIKQYD